MDGAWALYEAWVKIQTGDIDTALVYGYGKSSPGDLREVLSRQLDPYYLTPLWPDPCRSPPCRPGPARRRRHDRARLAEVAARSRRAAAGNPYAQLQGRRPVDDAARRARTSPRRCAATTARRSPTARRRRARRRRPGPRAERPPGVDPRHRPPHRGPRPRRARPHRTRRRPGWRGERAGWATARSTSPSCTPVHPPGGDPREALGLGDDVEVNPSGGPLAANPMMAAGLVRIGEAATRISDGEADGPSPTPPGPVPAAEPRLRPGRGGLSVGKDALRGRRHRPDDHQATRGRRVDRRPGARGRRARARRRRA